MTDIYKAAEMALEALEGVIYWDNGKPEWNEARAAIEALREALAQQPLPPPPECQTEAEKTAYAFGWWKAMEVNRAALAQQGDSDRQLDQLIQERDHRDEIIDKLCDAVLSPDRHEWSSMYFFEDAVREVEERMDALAQQVEQQPVAKYIGECHDGSLVQLYEDLKKGTELYAGAAPAAQPELTTCNCRWDGETQVQQCTLHEAHVDAIHEWAERAKTAEAALAQRGEQDRATRIGTYILETAKTLGWKDGGEGGYEYIQRLSYAQGVEDAKAAPAARPDTWTDDGGWTFPIEQPVVECPNLNKGETDA